nr:DNA helicase [Tanacetum cinerariifolium]
MKFRGAWACKGFGKKKMEGWLVDFLEVQTVNNVFYLTCRAACQALGLLGDNKEWDIEFEEACVYAMSLESRSLFAEILTHCDMKKILKTPHGSIFPQTIASPGEEGLLNLIDLIYDQNTLQTPLAVIPQQKATVCPKNETTDTINLKVLEMVQGESITYVSQDEATPTGNDGADTKMLYPWNI